MGGCFSKIENKSVDVDTFTLHNEIHFDSPGGLKLSRGEVAFATLYRTIDLKSTEDRRGCMVLTNMRVIWSDDFDYSQNVSVGLGCIKHDTLQV